LDWEGDHVPHLAEGAHGKCVLRGQVLKAVVQITGNAKAVVLDKAVIAARVGVRSIGQ
jgi:hypothetical protein